MTKQQNKSLIYQSKHERDHFFIDGIPQALAIRHAGHAARVIIERARMRANAHQDRIYSIVDSQINSARRIAT